MSVELLAAAVDVLRGDHFTRAQQLELAGALAAHVIAGASVDAMLGLAGHHPSRRITLLMSMRNAALKRLHERLSGERCNSAVLADIARLVAAPDEDEDAAEAALACRYLGRPLPSARRLREILNEDDHVRIEPEAARSRAA